MRCSKDGVTNRTKTKKAELKLMVCKFVLELSLAQIQYAHDKEG
tara:strand:+ start:1849 stop:1980 length:132 start_codon:yes stop_codon:yes gene_type:complete